MLKFFSPFYICIYLIFFLLVGWQDMAFGENDTLNLAPFTAIYKAKWSKFGFSVKTVRTLARQESGNYLFELKASHILQKIDESSTFKAQQCNLQPLEYHLQKKGIGKSRDILTVFDWSKKSAHYQTLETAGDTPLENGLIDKGDLQILLQCLVKNKNSDINVAMLDRDHVIRHHYRVSGEELIDNKALGKVNTVVIKRVSDKIDERDITIWFAKDYDYALVRMEQTEDGENYVLELTELNPVSHQ
jgi:hypothetical protein